MDTAVTENFTPRPEMLAVLRPWHLEQGDCIEVLRSLPDASVDAVVTDPPYGLEFMGKDWDAPWKHTISSTGYTDGAERLPRPSFTSSRNPICRSCGRRQRTWKGGPEACACAAPEWDQKQGDEMREFQRWCGLWSKELYRVLKPGGHLLAFGGTRTYHRMTCAIEDAGFEIRDSLHWIYGTGFPKSLDVSKAIAKRAGGTQKAREAIEWMKAEREKQGLSRIELETRIFGRSDGNVRNWEDAISLPQPGLWPKIREALGHLSTPFDAAMERGDEVVGIAEGSYGYQKDGERWNEDRIVRAPATDAAKQWAGWGTALKPAHEPVVVARKPLVGTVAENVQAHGTGAINVDACRIATDENLNGGAYSGGVRPTSAMGCTGEAGGKSSMLEAGGERLPPEAFRPPTGRWPANIVLDEEAAAELDAQSNGASRFFYCTKASRREREEGCADLPGRTATETTGRDPESAGVQSPRAGAGRGAGSPRYRCARCGLHLGGGRAATACVDGAQHAPEEVGCGPVVRNHHPTVKPVDLMRWLVRLVTPPGGVVLDPFTGSGTTGVAARNEGFRFIGIEREAAYVEIARRRISAAAIEAAQLSLPEPEEK